jgi:predicted extracellular nuclease
LTFFRGVYPLLLASIALAACVPAAAPAAPRIHTIQGGGLTSPLDGHPVAGVRGVVTVVRPNGFYLQDPDADGDDATSEAVLVFTNNRPSEVEVGDLLEIGGAVAEFAAAPTNQPTTQLVTPNWRVLARGRATPTPAPLTPPTDELAAGLAYFEAREGMLVQVDDAVVVGPRNRFGEVVVVGSGAGLRTARGGVLLRAEDPNPERIVLDDELLLAAREQMPSADVGDRLPGPVVGVLDYSFGNYKLQLLRPPRVERANPPRTTLPPQAPEQLAVATFNVENLHPGAAPEKLAALARLIVQHMAAPDLIALEEIQDSTGPRDDGTVAANETYTRLIAAVRAAGGPAYEVRQIDPENNRDGGEPGGNIRVAFMLRTDRGLRFVDRAGGDAATAARVVPGPALSFSPGRIDPRSSAWQSSRKPLVGELEWRERRLFAVANHFVSKGADAPLFGRQQPPPRPSETQRPAQAGAVHAFVAEILAADPDANVIVLGDLNDFPWSETLSTLRGGRLHALIDELPEAERYGYVFDGNAQALDYILVSEALRRVPHEYTIVHANAEYADRTSDHDPQVARFTLP